MPTAICIGAVFCTERCSILHQLFLVMCPTACYNFTAKQITLTGGTLMRPNNNIKQINAIVNSVIEQIDKEESKISLEVRQKQEGVDKNFEITHKEMNARYVESGKDFGGKVKAYVIRNVRLDCGLYFGSISETSERTGVSRRTVIDTFNELQYDDLIRLYKNGVWALHPKVLRRGNSGKYLGQLRFYYSLPKKERPKKDEKKQEEPTKLEAKLMVLR